MYNLFIAYLLGYWKFITKAKIHRHKRLAFVFKIMLKT